MRTPNTLPSSAAQSVFGADPSDGRALQVVQRAVEWLDANHLHTQGLWRQSGNRRSVSKLRATVNERGELPLEELQDPHDTTALLVRLLSDMPGRLVCTAVVQQLIDQTSSQPDNDQGQLLAVARREMSTMKRQIFECLLEHWRRVIGCKENKMDSRAVGVVGAAGCVRRGLRRWPLACLGASSRVKSKSRCSQPQSSSLCAPHRRVAAIACCSCCCSVIAW